MPAHRSTSPKTEARSKPYTRPTRQITYVDISDDDNEQPPALPSPSSSGNDGSSDYNPDLDTPTKSRGDHGQLYTFEDDEEDIKPDFDDDEISYPGIIADEHRRESDFIDEDELGKVKKGKGKGKAKSTTPKKPKGAGSVGGSGKKLGVQWTGDEDWAMFQEVHPKISPNWANVAIKVGRDAKSCQNRYAVFAKKLEALIKGMSGK